MVPIRSGETLRQAAGRRQLTTNASHDEWQSQMGRPHGEGRVHLVEMGGGPGHAQLGIGPDPSHGSGSPAPASSVPAPGTRRLHLDEIVAPAFVQAGCPL